MLGETLETMPADHCCTYTVIGIQPNGAERDYGQGPATWALMRCTGHVHTERLEGEWTLAQVRGTEAK